MASGYQTKFYQIKRECDLSPFTVEFRFQQMRFLLRLISSTPRAKMSVTKVANTINDKKYRIEKVAPEGAWGYLVGIGLTLPMACGLASLHSFGLMYNEFLASVGAETSAVTVVTGTFFSAMSIGSLFASPLFKKYTMRSVGVVGAFIYFIGSLLAAFVESVGMLIFSFGVLQGEN